VAALAIALSGVAVWRWQHALDDVNSVHASPVMNSRARTVVLVDEDSVADAANSVAEGDPFRLSNVPAFVAYSPTQDGGGLGAPAAPLVVRIRPTLLLKGIIGGPPWQAIVDGIPGQTPGAIVRPGMAFDKLVIRSISRDTVLVQGPDTSWKLTLGRVAP
jgi:hypothetical protein